MPIQQMLLGVGSAVADPTYVDDVFSTFLYKGAGSTNTITNNIDLTKGGLVWVKRRDGSYKHGLYDTVRGVHKRLSSDAITDEDTDTAGITGFTATGFTTGDANDVNGNNDKYSSWTFRKAPGFFDVVKYEGTGNVQTINHNLGCTPGCILIKRLDTDDNWNVYHQGQHSSNSAGYYLQLNTEDSIGGASNRWNNTAPTATQFTVGTAPVVNADDDEFIAYLFAGGKGTTDKAVAFDGSGDYLSVGSSSDFTMGTGDFTIECWVKFDETSNNVGVFQISDTSGGLRSANYMQTLAVRHTGSAWGCYGGGSGGSHSESPATDRVAGKWYHVAYVRYSGTTKLYIDGDERFSFSDSYDYDGTYIAIGGYYSASYLLDGDIANFRVVKGQALYKTTFNVPHDPLTTTSQNAAATNVKLLCCNGSTTTASTVTPGTITANGDPAVTTNNSIFDDTAANKFGELKDQNIIKTGSYIGDTQTDGPDVYLGWEPQYLLIKNAGTASTPWQVWDSMRGVVTGGNDEYLRLDSDDSKSNFERISFTPTGFKLDANSSYVNESGKKLIYIAIRRSDGYVGKPAELGTDVFTVVNSATDGNAPWMRTPNHIVDFEFFKDRTATHDWATSARLIQGNYLKISTNAVESAHSLQKFDYQDGFNSGTESSGNYTGWLWKRHAGFDVVTYTGDAVSGRQIRHSMNKTPEMLWVKTRDSTENWIVGHKGLDNGSDPWDHEITLNETAEEANNVNKWNDTAPTSTHFTLGNGDAVNKDDDKYIALLFASVDGISKVGNYIGNGSNSGAHVTVGFTPRFLWVKRADVAGSWYVVDTLRGLSSSSANDDTLYFNQDVSQTTGQNWVQTSNTGFTPLVNWSAINADGGKYIYYAHA